MISPIIYKSISVPFGSKNIDKSRQVNVVKPMYSNDYLSYRHSAVYNPIIYPPKINLNRKPSLYDYNIPNLHMISESAARGESLSSPKNRKYLRLLRASGIKNIIDLREKYSSDKYPELCKKYGLIYHNIPVDSSTVSDRTIIDSLPKLFKLINGNSYYIACAQGLHRTDIALALNYVFNPKEKKVPIMIGHFRDTNLKIDDIARRLNSIKRTVTPEDIKKFGWGDNFEDEFIKRKKQLFAFNTNILKEG